MKVMGIKKSSNLKKGILTTLFGLIVVLEVQSTPVFAQAMDINEKKSVAADSAIKGDDNDLPNPLTLEYLLSEYPLHTPQIQLQNARLQQAKGDTLASQITANWQANIEGRLGWREFAQDTQDHHQLALHLGKVLYDFNQSDLSIKSAQQNVVAEQLLIKSVLNQQKLAVMQAFFNVLLSDFQFRVDDEAMAVEYVNFDKIKDLHAIGQRSDVDLLAADLSYQKILVDRTRSESRQLQTRVQLANILHQPNARPGEFTFPNLKSFSKRSLKDVDLQELQEQVLRESPKLHAVSQRLESQRLALESALAVGSPTLRADAWAGKLSSYPNVREGTWRAELSVNIPLYDGGTEEAAVATAKANFSVTEAEYQQSSQSLRKEVTELYFQIKLLQAEKKQHQAFGDYADLYLDYSRALYEHESATDLGDSMVRLSQANYDLVAWQFKQALLWSQIDYLMGKKVCLDNGQKSDDSPFKLSLNKQEMHS
ncbi:TolC family protein [Thiomicrorhabdus arctica]|uniref:TolC family protein n=1 Tax=Thiomicrorhabdus arctica TaxID=131540 RepID=UPI0003AA3607|nr:TolC family protein [Thiomicrorhabdus arctica]